MAFNIRKLMPNSANTVDNAYYTPNSRGQVHSQGRNGRMKAPHGYRFVSVDDDDKTRIGATKRADNGGSEIAKYETGGKEGTHARVVSRNQQYRAIRKAFGLSAG